MPICIECNKYTEIGYQTVKTKRGSEIHICNTCLQAQRKKNEVNNAVNSKQSV